MRKAIIFLIALTLIGFGILSGCLDGEENGSTKKTPVININWTELDTSITITDRTEGIYYNSDSTTNIKFLVDHNSVSYYVDENLALTDTKVSLSTKIIEKDDEITGFNKYHNYSVIWLPTNTLLGKVTFENLGSPIVTFGQYDEITNVTLYVTISNPEVPWSDIICTLRDVDGGTEQTWEGIGVDKDSNDGIIDYEVIDDGDKEVSVGDSVKIGYSTNLADNIVEENEYSFSITYLRTGEVIGSLGWDPTP